ncbi:hypothetical protein ACWGDS_10980 [Streptomyces sp. NPDC055059]|jgi:hypothetical protein|uniref:hypothetical protein n=1 Tax=Streptomyces sp. NPDC127172 TaxID=3345382 RepID=UPI00362C087F
MVLVAVFGVALLIAVLLPGLATCTAPPTFSPCSRGVLRPGALLGARSPQAKQTSAPLGESLAELAAFAVLSVSGALLTPQLFGDLPMAGAGKAARLMQRLIGGS